MASPALSPFGVDTSRPDSMDTFRPIDAPTHPDACALLKVWQKHQETDGFVVGRDIPSKALARLLPNIVVYEPVDGGHDSRVRIAGAAIRRRWGRDITGTLLTDLFSEKDARLNLMRTRGVLITGKPVFLDSKVHRSGVEELHLEVVVLPVFSPDRKEKWSMVGLFYFE